MKKENSPNSGEEKDRVIATLRKELHDLKKTAEECLAMRRQIAELQRMFDQQAEYQIQEEQQLSTSEKGGSQFVLAKNIGRLRQRIAKTVSRNEQLATNSTQLGLQLNRIESDLTQSKEENNSLIKQLQHIPSEDNEGRNSGEQPEKAEQYQAEVERISKIEQSRLQTIHNIAYISLHISQLRQDIDQEQQVIANLEEGIGVFDAEKKRVQKRNRALHERYQSSRKLRDDWKRKAQQALGQIDEQKEHINKIKLANHDLSNNIERTQDLLDILAQENREVIRRSIQLESQLQRIKMENDHVQQFIRRNDKRAKDSPTESPESDLDKTVLRSSIRPRRKYSPA